MSDSQKVKVLGVGVDPFTVDSLHAEIKGICRNGKKSIVANVNVYALNLAYQQEWLKRFFNRSDYVFCDGHGVMLGARILGQRIPEKITYAHWFPLFCGFCEKEGLSLYFLGGRFGVAEKARENLIKQYPALQVVGIHHGYFDKVNNSAENQAVLVDINRKKPDVLLVSFGMPAQEMWLKENWDKINAHVALTGGAALDYMAGVSRRPPAWMTKYGLEWLGRMFYEPRRLWKRYIIGNPVFVFRVVKEAVRTCLFKCTAG